MDSQRLKSLQVRRTALQQEVQELSGDLTRIKATVDQKWKGLKEVEKEIKNLSSQDPILSEHALLRYIERVMGINLEEIKKKILTEEAIKTINVLSSGRIPLSNDLDLVVKDKTIITITERKK